MHACSRSVEGNAQSIFHAAVTTMMNGIDRKSIATSKIILQWFAWCLRKVLMLLHQQNLPNLSRSPADFSSTWICPYRVVGFLGLATASQNIFLHFNCQNSSQFNQLIRHLNWLKYTLFWNFYFLFLHAPSLIWFGSCSCYRSEWSVERKKNV